MIIIVTTTTRTTTRTTIIIIVIIIIIIIIIMIIIVHLYSAHIHFLPDARYKTIPKNYNVTLRNLKTKRIPLPLGCLVCCSFSYIGTGGPFGAIS